jgi:hypothetical protein
LTTFVPFQFISLYIFAGVFNFSLSVIMFYLRSKGGTGSHTKSQLWGLTILAWIFFLNGLICFTEGSNIYLTDMRQFEALWYTYTLYQTLILFTCIPLLAFGLVYPRPIASWKWLKYIIFGLMLMGVLVTIIDIQRGHGGLAWFWSFPPSDLLYIPTIFIPVFIWLSQYSRTPSKEGRMMYTIFIWGFLFVVITHNVQNMIVDLVNPSMLVAGTTVIILFLILAFIKLFMALRSQRKRWALPEWMHLVFIVLSFIIAISGGVHRIDQASTLASPPYPDEHFYHFFMSVTFGWAIFRPALFSYGLLRYRLLGTQVKAEHALAILGAILMATTISIAIVNISGAEDDPSLVGGAILIGLVAIFPLWKVSQRGVTRLLPVSAGARGVSMKERRDTYFMALQTAVVQGEVPDNDDMKALMVLRKALGVTEREHDLLLESIALHEARRVPKREIEEVYLIYRDGRLLAHYLPEMKERPVVEGAPNKDKDIVAGMFAAITQYVKEAMRRGKAGKASMDTISYGASSLVIERERNLVLAVVLTGIDDLVLRQAMRDTLADVDDKYGRILTDEWDGSQEELEGIDKMLEKFTKRLVRWER